MREGVPGNFIDQSTQLRTSVGGNPELESETAKIFTVGAVWEVPMLEGLSFTLDYFNVNIDNAIQAIGSDVILANCYNSPDHTECDKIHRRSGTGLIDYIDDKQVNIGGNVTSGLDFAVAYEKSYPHAGRFRGQLEGTYLFKYQETNSEKTREGRGVYDLGVFPDVKANLLLAWGKRGFGAGTNVHYVGGYEECQDNDCNLGTLPSRDVDASVTADFFASYDMKSAAGKTMISGGVNNVLDTPPPAIYFNAPDADASAYDFMGRYFYLRLTQAF
jgi:outer membrane receptor protein involved in Fe transport